MTATTQIVTESSVQIDVPLNKLKKSPKNARKVPYSAVALAPWQPASAPSGCSVRWWWRRND